jgi:hypothetical protein
VQFQPRKKGKDFRTKGRLAGTTGVGLKRHCSEPRRGKDGSKHGVECPRRRLS